MVSTSTGAVSANLTNSYDRGVPFEKLTLAFRPQAFRDQPPFALRGIGAD